MLIYTIGFKLSAIFIFPHYDLRNSQDKE